ncbi:MAG: hypothetical protein ABH822_01775 [Patescibacteria group bacterium]
MSQTLTKKRINISVSDDINQVLSKLAHRDKVPVATKTLELLKEAIQIEEDEVWEELAEARDQKNVNYLSHKQVWGEDLK